MFFAVLAILILILLAVLYAPVKGRLSFENTDFTLSVSFFGVLVYKRRLNRDNNSEKQEKDIEKKVKKFEQNTLSLGKRIKLFCKVSKYTVSLIRKYVSIESISAQFTVGTGDAAITAISTGIIWATVYNLLGIIGRVAYIDKHNLQVVPDYANIVFSSKGECIIKSHLAYIIFIMISIRLKIKALKGEEEE